MFRISFFIDDKYLATTLTGLAGRARDLSVEPVVNAKAKANGMVREIAGSRSELLHKELKVKGVKEFDAKMAQGTLEYLGIPPNKYYNIITRGTKEGLFKKGKRGKGMTGHTYLVV